MEDEIRDLVDYLDDKTESEKSAMLRALCDGYFLGEYFKFRGLTETEVTEVTEGAYHYVMMNY